MSGTIVLQGVTYGIEMSEGSFVASGIIVLGGSVVTASTFGGSGSEDVERGGLSDGNTFSGINSELTVEAGALSYQDSIGSAGAADISGTAWNLSVTNGNIIDVESGGTLESGQFGTGSDIHILAGANDYSSTINSGSEWIYGGNGAHGKSTGAVVENRGLQAVYGGIAYNSTAASGGELVGEGNEGTFVNFQIQSGGSGTLFAESGFDGGTVAGILDVNSGATASGTLTIESGAHIIIPIADLSTLGSTSGVELLLTGTTAPALAGPVAHVTLGSRGVLDVGSAAITFGGGAGAVLEEIADGDNVLIDVPCYVKGTMIAAKKGGTERQLPIEELVEGDEVVTKEGSQIVEFIGKRSYGGRFVAGDDMKLPICVRTGALGKNQPAQDLYVSPGHALLIDDVLIQARHLINEVNITQAASVERIDYFHIGLRHHAVVMANGCWAESFYDDGSIRQFQNASNHSSRRPISGGSDEMYRPLVHCGEEVEQARREIAFRAVDLLHGFIDSITVKKRAVDKSQTRTALITGWAQSRALGQSEYPVALDIYVCRKNGAEQKIASVLANMARRDLRDHFGTSGRHSFQISVSLPVGVSANKIVVRGTENGQEIPLHADASAALKARRPRKKSDGLTERIQLLPSRVA